MVCLPDRSGFRTGAIIAHHTHQRMETSVSQTSSERRIRTPLCVLVSVYVSNVEEGANAQDARIGFATIIAEKYLMLLR
jgi:hypothetical protein